MNMLLYQVFVALSKSIGSYLAYTEKNIISYKNGKFKILAPTWNNKFELPDEPFSKNMKQ